MLKMLLSGCNGRMGQTVSRLAAKRTDMQVLAGCDLTDAQNFSYPVYTSPNDCDERPDVVLDFSNPDALSALLGYCEAFSTPLVLCSTGYDAAQLARIECASQTLPVFRSGNMSLGVYLLMELARKAAEVLGTDFDVEILEKHHNNKLDAPSGTALMLLDALSGALPYQPEPVFNRQPEQKKRGSHEIGLHSVRGGTIIGEHEVLFAGHDEIITITHSARSREVFAAGAIRAAIFMAGVKNPGLYDMRDILK